MKQLIIASSSTVFGEEPLEYLFEELKLLYQNTDTVVFIPYARPGGISYDKYTEKVSSPFKKMGKELIGIHEFDDPIAAIKSAKGLFIGGGNTFVLLNQLYKNQLIQPIINAVNTGTPYLGTSAGSNICGLTMGTTNDMPIIYPPSFKTFGFVPFNINPHYLDPNPNSEHMGETRETRIGEFHKFNTQPVIGLREGSWIDVNNNDLIIKGPLNARIFEREREPYELPPFSNLKNLL